jgi:hypothetical protein
MLLEQMSTYACSLVDTSKSLKQKSVVINVQKSPKTLHYATAYRFDEVIRAYDRLVD